ncbi:MAG: terminase small subunit [Magnetovibrio sp.]|nr:terminase small subunit [Magnetovibrio sp.]
MPLNHRQERFCRFFVHYGTAATAAREAGYARPSAHKTGWRLLRVPGIRARIREIQSEIAEHRDLAERTAIGKLQVVYERALEDHQFHAAARAADLQLRIQCRHGERAPAARSRIQSPTRDQAGAAAGRCERRRPNSHAGSRTSALPGPGNPPLRPAG